MPAPGDHSPFPRIYVKALGGECLGRRRREAAGCQPRRYFAATLAPGPPVDFHSRCKNCNLKKMHMIPVLASVLPASVRSGSWWPRQEHGMHDLRFLNDFQIIRIHGGD